MKDLESIRTGRTGKEPEKKKIGMGLGLLLFKILTFYSL
jgi:hypothetical protein